MLVLRALGVGDLLTVVPALRALRRLVRADHAVHDQRGRVVLACPRYLQPLVQLMDAVDAVKPVGGLEGPLRWAGRPPDIAVNLHGRGPQSHRLLAAARPGRLLAFACPDAGDEHGPVWTDGEHEVLRWCRLLSAHGVPADPADLSLALPAQPSPVPGAVVVHPGAAYESRRWPPERYARVARALEALAPPVIVTGTAAERARAEYVADAAGLSRERVLAGRTGLAALAALVADARLVVCGDTGMGHLATAYRTPSVLLFGPSSPAEWGPPPDRPWHRTLWHGRRGDPRASVPDPGLLAISDEEVVEASSALLSRRSVLLRAATGERVPDPVDQPYTGSAPPWRWGNATCWGDPGSRGPRAASSGTVRCLRCRTPGGCRSAGY